MIKAIVLDANAFGASVEPNVATIENWAAACENHDAQLWIPEIVAWELAQRVKHQADEMAHSLAVHNTKRHKWGFPPLSKPALLTEVEVIDRLERAGAIIVPLTGDAAVAGVRDQVLLLGPAVRKKDVKTGAADSAWIRSVIEHNGGGTEDLILVTGDQQAVEKTCAALEVDLPRIAKNLGEIQHLLNESSSATAEQTEKYQKLAQQYFAGPDLTGSDLIDLLGLSRREWWDVDLGLDYGTGWELQQKHVTPGTLDVISEVQFDNWSGSTSATVRMTVAVEEQYARQDQWGDLPEFRVFCYDGWVEGRLTIFADTDSGVGTLEDYRLGVEDGSLTSQPM